MERRWWSWVMLVGVGLWAPWARGEARSGSADDLVRVMSVVDGGELKAGRPLTLGVMLAVRAGWHVYWMNPGDAGRATQLKVTLPEGWTAGPVAYPVPETFEQPGSVVGYGYNDRVLLTVQVTPPAGVREGASITLSGEVSWLACREACTPGRAVVRWTVPAEDSASKQGLFAAWALRYPQPAEKVGATVRKGIDGEGKGWVEVRWGQRPAEVRLLTVPGDSFEVQEVGLQEDGTTTRIRYRVVLLAGQAIDKTVLPMVVAYRMEPGEAWRGLSVEQELGK